MSLRFLSLLLLCWLNLELLAQVPVFRHYSIAQGLPSTEVHDIHQDQDGFIWMATDHGLVRYDGQSFEIFSTQDGLTDNTIFDIVEDSMGTLWVSTYSGGISFWQNGYLNAHPHNDLILETLNGYYIPYFEVDENGSIDFSISLSTEHKNEIYHLDIHRCLDERKDLKMTFWDKEERGQITEADLRVYLRKVLDKEVFIESEHDYLISKSGRVYLNLGWGLYVYYPDKNRFQKLVDGYRTQRIWEDEEGHLWVGLHLGAGLQRISFHEHQFQIEDWILKGKTITDILLDREGNYWISTVEDGVYFIAQTAIKSYANIPTFGDPILSVHNWKESLWIGFSQGYIARLGKGSNIEKYINEEYTAPVTTISSNQDYLFATNNFFYSDISHSHITDEIRSLKSITTSGDDFWLGGIFGLYHFIAGDPPSAITKIPTSPKSIYSLWADQNEVIWMGTLTGLYTLHKKQVNRFNHPEYDFSERITCIQGIGKDKLIFATKGGGIILMQEDQILQLDDSDGLNSVFVKSIHLQNDSTLWVGGNKGLNCIHFSSDGWTIKNIDSYDQNDGLPSDEIFDIESFDDKIWLATSKGLCSIDPCKLKSSPAPLLQISEFRVNQEKYPLDINHHLSPNPNTIEVDFIGLHYRNGDMVKYQYQLQGYDDELQETQQNTIRYTNLPAGDFSLQIWAASPDGTWTASPQILKFSVRQVIYKRWWFIFLCILLFLALLWWSISYYNRRHREKNELERKIIQSEQKALRAQINPHFIFNAMNSIQYFVTQNDRHHAGIYLSQFSKLIRRILENSKKNWISLEEEIEGLQYYLDLEQLRFVNKFDYQIEIAKEVNRNEIEIPAMMIQPFLENAIWHGFNQKKDKGLLHIHFKYQHQHLCCIISDNGIGREAAMARRRKKPYQSTGINNIMERMELLNQQHHLGMRVSIDDLKDEYDAISGTRVSLYFSGPSK